MIPDRNGSPTRRLATTPPVAEAGHQYARRRERPAVRRRAVDLHGSAATSAARRRLRMSVHPACH